ncbi:MAG TPA: TetR/AcrR family transcriptional regulator [Vicinamibacteria bacterium]|nr:TetR/AcrR family transcriptional regulator [Vicinamibacteria bacterium]
MAIRNRKEALTVKPAARRARETRPTSSRWQIGLSREELRRLKRDAVIKAAWQAFSRSGYHGTSLDDIAESLHVTKPSLYYYFENKEALLYECHLQAIARFARAIEEAIAAETTGLDQLRHAMVGYFETLTRDFGSSRVVGEDAALSGALYARVMTRWDELVKTVRGMVEVGIKDGSIAPCDARIAVFAVVGAIFWLHAWFSPEGRLTAREAAEATFDQLVRGLAPRSPAADRPPS